MKTGRGRPRGATGPTTEGGGETAILFVRGFPKGLLRESRALASLRGVSIREVLADALRAYLAQAPDWKGRP